MSLKFRWRFGRPDPIDLRLLHCSFCGKSENAVKKLIAGPTVFICDECVSVCNDILSGEARLPHQVHPADAAAPPPHIPSDPVRYLTCAMCRMATSWDDAVLVPERGAICAGCVGEIEAAIATKRDQSA